MQGAAMFPRGVAVALTVTFYLERPKSLPKRETLPTKKPDLDKICRARGDALAGIVYQDDSQVVEIHACKRFGLPQRAEIEVRAI